MAVEPEAQGAPPTGAATVPPTPTVEQAAVRPKSIVLFSDGTGNSSGKLFKTNVWRMYEAVDLGLPPSADRVQIAYYDSGIGTSKNKAWAALTGIFGIGLKRNMLGIYRFVCRNYRPGDSIYAFGFSRGAFTIRLVAGMISKMGIVLYETDAELEARSLDVLREYCAKNGSNMPVARVNRSIRNGLVWLKRRILGPKNLRPRQMTDRVPIAFLGVWDTVAAYGGPSAEVTRAIDTFIHPLTMNDHKLNDLVSVARHALSIDDERDAFQPVLWDEVAWDQEAPAESTEEQRKVHNERLQQLWFAGMHSDVGGGYPDESLSYVSLLWMMYEAQSAKLRLLPSHVERVRDTSNSLGPIHNSRAGLASYYRYQPRKIAAFLHPDSGMDHVAATLSLRDPFEKERRGHLLRCQIHESVAARIAFGTDGYAPIILPERVEIVPYSTALTGQGGNPHVSQEFHDDLATGNSAAAARQEALYDLVWYRRLAYFLTVAATLLLLCMPLYVARIMLPRTLDNRWIFERLTGWTHYSLPGFVQPWVKAFESSPLWFCGLIALIAIGSFTGHWLRTRIHTGMRGLWTLRIRQMPIPAAPDPSPLQRGRNNPIYQRGLQLFKWVVLPTIVGLAMLLAIAYAVAIISSQVKLSFSERDDCHRSDSLTTTALEQGYDFRTKSRCNFLTFSNVATGKTAGFQVQRNHRYAVVFVVPKIGNAPNWKDEDVPASPEGLAASDLGWAGFAGAPFRRVVDVRYMQPLYQVRPPNKDGRRPGSVIVKPIEFTPEGVEGDCLIYRGDIQPAADGELFLYVNDATVYGFGDRFYSNNHGTAKVFIHDWNRLPGPDEDSEEGAAEKNRRCRLAIDVKEEPTGSPQK